MYDVIIIGSGASGGAAARVLHEGGAKVLLLEAGKFFRKDTFPDNEAEYSAKMFWGGGLEFNSSAKTAFLRAKCVGGTTIVNQCLMDRFDENCLNDWKARTGVEFMSVQAMTPWYEKTEENICLHTFKEEERNKNAQKFTEACDKIGFQWKYLRRGQSDCKLEEGNDCMGCLGGCFRDSKQSTLVTSIQVAEKNGLEIITEFEVGKIEHQTDGVKIFGVHHGEKKQLKAPKVILAGGSFGTTKMMLASGFKSQLPTLGKGFCQHPQFMSFGIFDEPVNAHHRAFQSVASSDPRFREKGFKLENVYGPPVGIGMLFHTYGVEHQRLMAKYRYMSSIEVAIRDDASGEIKLDNKGNLVVEKELTAQDIQRKKDGQAALKEVLSAQGAKEIYESPTYFGLHLMGGCVIGADGAKSVVSPDFSVHGNRNLFIADTSIYPSAPGINPSLTASTFGTKLANELLTR